MIICSEIANAATYRIGDAKGWSFNVENWTQGKKFILGDVLSKCETIPIQALFRI